MEASKQKLVGCLLAAGVVICFCSGALIWVVSVAGIYRGTYTRTPVTNQITDAGPLNYVPVLITFVVIGLLMVAGAVVYGLMQVGSERKGPRQVLENFHVIARFAFTRDGNMLTDPFDIEVAENPRFYVRGAVPYREVLEYETSEEMFFQCGEGMTGEAELQGKWIGRFTPYIGTPPGP